ncbi:hypothetical protein RESH_04369 [Rhodopirellula europaea SH398]|uniref:Uncharacterized protein n=2 Tax=Rhodopirellula TaxID=265488 RepID=M5S0U3_9BACT|nr:hypothetical protein RESH_04369 [Rhodopirellula europaea SH398]
MTEGVRDEQYETDEQATRSASDFIEYIFDSVRLYSSIDCLSPIKFEQHQARALSLNSV